jgi:hypothetical protein
MSELLGVLVVCPSDTPDMVRVHAYEHGVVVWSGDMTSAAVDLCETMGANRRVAVMRLDRAMRTPRIDQLSDAELAMLVWDDPAGRLASNGAIITPAEARAELDARRIDPPPRQGPWKPSAQSLPQS